MNILITNISAFPYNVTEFEYEVRIDNCEVEKIKAKHTNESILKCLTHLGDVKKNGGINKIIALVSQKTLNDRDERFDNCTALKNVYFETTLTVQKSCNYSKKNHPPQNRLRVLPSLMPDHL